MADIDLLTEQYPALRDFREDGMVCFRGDILSYVANLDKPSFSTDDQGFRHSMLGGKRYSVVECIQSPRYGLAFGPSTFFGSGIAGNENILASRLAERFGFPFANAAMPGGNSRSLYALLLGLLTAAKQPPAVVVLSNGGDLASFCNTGMADPIFGSPNRMQKRLIPEADRATDPNPAFQRMLVFTKLWTSATASLCKSRGIPLVLVHQSTFFEKAKPSAIERKLRLGEPARANQEQMFANFRRFNAPFFEHRQELAQRLGIPLAQVAAPERLNFMDEFHLTLESLGELSQAVADAIDPLIASGPPA